MNRAQAHSGASRDTAYSRMQFPGLIKGALGWSRTFAPGVAGLVITAVMLGAVGCSGGAGPVADAAEAVPDPENTLAPAADSTAVPGVFDNRIRFGQSAAFSGPASELGLGMNVGIQAAFREVNKRGGVHGRILELTSIDDT